MKAQDKPSLDPTLRASLRGVAMCGVVFSLGALLGFGGGAAVGVLAGGVLATLNLAAFIIVGRAFLAQQGRSAPWAVIGGLKLVALLVVAWLIIRSGYVSALALAIGYGALPVGITLGSLFGKKPNDFHGSDDLA